MSDLIVGEFRGDSCDWYDVPCHASSFADWLFELVIAVPQWFFNHLLDWASSVAIEYLVNAPIYKDVVGDAFSLAGPGLLWVANILQLEYGLNLLMTSLTLRFVMRRIPLVG